MQETPLIPPAAGSSDFDYSTPEAQNALRDVTALVLEVRTEATEPMARKIAIYERTLGLAVIPVLLRRAVIALRRGFAQGPSGHS